MTAMMAFLLLLWLLNATTEEQKMGLADYFSPASVSNPNSGSGGVLGRCENKRRRQSGFLRRAERRWRDPADPAVGDQGSKRR